MKIAISCYPSLGGSGFLATELGMELADRGHEIHFVAYEKPLMLDPARGDIRFHEVDLTEYPLFQCPPYCLLLAVKLSELIEEHDLDVVHVHYAIPHAVSAYLSRQFLGRSRTRIITTLHGTDITIVGQKKSFQKAVEFAIEHSDRVTAVSHFLQQESLRAFNLTKPIQVIYNFVDNDRFHPAARPPDPEMIFTDRPFAIHASNLRPIKRIGDAIHAFAKVRKELTCGFIIAGEGPELPKAKKLANSLGLTADVRFIGRFLSIEQLFAPARMLMLPSGGECFGLVALEALSCETPVIGYRLGGLPEVVEHGRSGFLLESGDIDGLADAMLTLFRNPGKALEMGRRGRRIALERFSTNRIIPQYEKLYRSVIAEDRDSQ